MNTRKPKLALELALTLALLVVGTLVLPALIYWVGSKFFGAYSTTSAGLPAFYLNFGNDLTAAKLSAWTIAIGPLMLAFVVRVIVGAIPFTSKTGDSPVKPNRVEPSIHS